MPSTSAHDIIRPRRQHGSVDLHPSNVIQLASLYLCLPLIGRIIRPRIFARNLPVICRGVRRSPRHVDQIDVSHTVEVQVGRLWACQHRFEGRGLDVYTDAIARRDVRRLARGCNPLLEPAVDDVLMSIMALRLVICLRPRAHVCVCVCVCCVCCLLTA